MDREGLLRKHAEDMAAKADKVLEECLEAGITYLDSMLGSGLDIQKMVDGLEKKIREGITGLALMKEFMGDDSEIIELAYAQTLHALIGLVVSLQDAREVYAMVKDPEKKKDAEALLEAMKEANKEGTRHDSRNAN